MLAVVLEIKFVMPPPIAERLCTTELKDILFLQTQIAQLLQFGGRDADRERISRLEQALMSSQSDAKLLTHKVVDLEAKVCSC